MNEHEPTIPPLCRLLEFTPVEHKADDNVVEFIIGDTVSGDEVEFTLRYLTPDETMLQSYWYKIIELAITKRNGLQGRGIPVPSSVVMLGNNVEHKAYLEFTSDATMQDFEQGLAESVPPEAISQTYCRIGKGFIDSRILDGFPIEVKMQNEFARAETSSTDAELQELRRAFYGDGTS